MPPSCCILLASTCPNSFSQPAPPLPPPGTHLIAHSCYRTIDRNGQFVLLGSAPDPRIQAEFDALANQVGRRAGWGV